MRTPGFDFKGRWQCAARLMEQRGVDALFVIGNSGVYREDFGVRMEDTVWISEERPVSLTRHPKALAS